MSKRIDLTGNKYNRLTVIKYIRTDVRGMAIWECRCDCGEIREVKGNDLKSGKTKSCGCLNRELAGERRRLTFEIGHRVGRLTVVGYAGINNNLTMFDCLCDCGNTKTVSGYALKSERTRSCGCLMRENIKQLGNNAKTHGLGKTRLYNIWSGIKSRCNNPKDTHYSYYGGRGISICDEWVNDYKQFHEWAIENDYTDDLSIDRIDVNGNYEPLNCKWATKTEQAQNRRVQKVENWLSQIKELEKERDYWKDRALKAEQAIEVR